jgi:CcmD family protein
VSYLIAAYGVTGVTLIAYALALHRERRRLSRELGRGAR